MCRGGWYALRYRCHSSLPITFDDIRVFVCLSDVQGNHALRPPVAYARTVHSSKPFTNRKVKMAADNSWTQMWYALAIYCHGAFLQIVSTEWETDKYLVQGALPVTKRTLLMIKNLVGQSMPSLAAGSCMY